MADIKYSVDSADYPLTRHFYEGSRWYNNNYDGYAASSTATKKYFAAIGFTTPDFSNSGGFVSINFNMPFIRDQGELSKRKAEGTFYYKLYTSLPTSGFPSSSNNDATAEWVCRNSKGVADTEVHTLATPVSLDVSNLKANTQYYLVFSSSSIIQVGYENVDPRWKINLTTYVNGKTPTISITDNGNNTFSISGTLGAGGDENGRTSSVLYYTTDGSDPGESATRTKVNLDNSVSTFNKTYNITKACTVKAKVVCNFTYNATSAEKSLAVKYYAAPTWPSNTKVELAPSSFKNNRLTVKQNWGWQWTLANATNTSSPVKGYRVRFFVKRKDSSSFVNTKIIDYYDKETAKSYELTTGDWVYDRASTSYPMPMAAADFEQDILPGDEIKLSVQAYSVNGVDEKLLADEITSNAYTVQNAGVVNVKVAGEWKEGQVWVKVAGEWKEAETVNVKTASGWQESQ
jgi:hypothetical protein